MQFYFFTYSLHLINIIGKKTEEYQHKFYFECNKFKYMLLIRYNFLKFNITLNNSVLTYLKPF